MEKKPRKIGSGGTRSGAGRHPVTCDCGRCLLKFKEKKMPYTVSLYPSVALALRNKFGTLNEPLENAYAYMQALGEV